ncbi:MAG: hypothetical protein QM743_13040 [Chitinophagaceae bacterium]
MGFYQLVFTLLFVFPLFSVSNRKKYYLITVLSLALFAAILSRSDYIRERFTTELSSDLKTGKQVFTARNPEPRELALGLCLEDHPGKTAVRAWYRR